MKKRIQEFVAKHYKTGLWALALTAVVLVTAWIGRTVWNLWTVYPPTDTPTTWAFVDGIGSVLSAVVGVWLGLVAFRGLESLRLTRLEIEHKSDHERKLIAIQRLEDVAKTIIPMNAEILDVLAAKSIKPFLKADDRIQFSPDPSDLTSARAWIGALPPDTSPKIVNFLNHWESWCVYFTTGVADEDVAFEPVAPLLRAAVGQYYPVLLVLRAASASGTFPNIVRLFTLWSAKMDAAQLARVYSDVVAELDRNKTRLAKAQLPKAGPKLD